MKLRYTFRTFIYYLIFGFAFWGCSENKSSILDQDDMRFAGFYSDYLLFSGVTAGDQPVFTTALNSGEVITLLENHTLTREHFTKKIQYYKQNPERWRAVLMQVRENIRKKSFSGK
ncbi:MAG: hypothetical protein WCK32_06905 [Chlorobiaceae bacterium]